jgi:hypothetical protein
MQHNPKDEPTLMQNHNQNQNQRLWLDDASKTFPYMDCIVPLVVQLRYRIAHLPTVALLQKARNHSMHTAGYRSVRCPVSMSGYEQLPLLVSPVAAPASRLVPTRTFA